MLIGETVFFSPYSNRRCMFVIMGDFVNFDSPFVLIGEFVNYWHIECDGRLKMYSRCTFVLIVEFVASYSPFVLIGVLTPLRSVSNPGAICGIRCPRNYPLDRPDHAVDGTNDRPG